MRGEIHEIASGHGGWARFRLDGLPGDIFLRFRPDSTGRLRVVEMLAQTRKEPLDAGHLRSLPLHKLEAAANDGGMKRAIEANLDVSVDPAKTLHGPGGGFGGDSDGALAAPTSKPPKPRRLSTPKSDVYPEAFFSRVADHYRWYVETGSRRPAAQIAEDADVAVTTVHRWIREARRRGHLPPGRQGASG